MKLYAKCLVSTFVGLFLAASSAEAATPRAYVSVNGNDANTCNVPATPCRTYTGAITQVTPGGEVIVLDSGTFGGGTISQSVTINAPAGVVALSATSLIVNPGAGLVVVLRGLTFQAPVPGSGTAIDHQSGTLFVENTVVDGWQNGLTSTSAAEGLFVKGSVFRNNTTGLSVQSGSTAKVAIDESFFERNETGIGVVGGSGRVSNTMMTANTFGAAFFAGEFLFERCELSGNGNFGLYAVSATLRVSHSTMTRNGVGIENGGSGAVVESFGNNVIRGNGTNTLGTITTVALQ
jgi:hypothetical protein